MSRTITSSQDLAKCWVHWTCSDCKFEHIVTKLEIVKSYSPDRIVLIANERAESHDCKDYEPRTSPVSEIPE